MNDRSSTAPFRRGLFSMMMWRLVLGSLTSIPFISAIAASSVVGPTSVCPGTTNLYSVVTDSTRDIYAWAISTNNSAGALILGGTNGVSVLVLAPTNGEFTLDCLLSDGEVRELVTTNIFVPGMITGSALTNQVACLGDNVTFATTVAGAPGYSVLWRKDGEVLAGATTETLALTNVGTASAGDYCVEVSGPCNNLTNCATLALVPAAILGCPTNLLLQCVAEIPSPDPQQVTASNAVAVLHLGDSAETNGCEITISRAYAAVNSCGQTSTCAQVIVVRDTTPPVLVCASNRVVQCGDAWDFESPTASDICSGPNVTVAIVSTTTNLLIGETLRATRIWSATDACNNSNTCSQTITIVDTTPPQIVCSSNIVVECAGASGTTVAFTVTASDGCDSNVTVVAIPPSGSAFALGTNPVVCTATDDSGNTNQCIFEVIVLDTIPPQISCPPNLVVSEAPRDSEGARVNLAPPTVLDICDAAPQLFSSPASGSIFAVGTNTVTWTAVDSSGNSNSCTFTVRVIPYRLFVVTNVDDAGPGSLRQAILDGNDAPDENLIIFQLPGPGLYTINLLSPLPPITSPTTIDGWSQSGSNAPPVVELDGGSNAFDGLVIRSGPSVVRGLALHGFATAIRIEGGGTNVIQGNYLGPDLTGTNVPGNAGDGIYLDSAKNLIGGTIPGTGNLISGNGGNGLTLATASAINNVIQGNIIGAPLDAAAPLSNAGHGIFLTNGPARNLIGGHVGSANLIAFNGGAGVALDGSAGAGNAVLGNSMIGNGGLGIDLGVDGVTANDADDSDLGPNNVQNYPILSDARSASGVTVVEGELSSTPNTTFRIEFFLNDTADPSSHGEGRLFLGSTEVRTRGDGAETFSASFPVTAVFTQFVTATATDSEGNTSEFSPAVQVRTPPVIEVQPQSTNSTAGDPVTFCAVASGTPPIHYQWRLNGVNIPGATNACYTIPSTAIADGGTYTVVIGNELDAFATSTASLVLGGSNFLNLSVGDNFAGAVDLSEYGSGTNGVLVGDSGGATLEHDEPRHAGKPGGRSVWYRWCTPTGSKGIATFRTTGSTFDTVMAVYQGSAFSNLVEVASDEDGGRFYSSEVRFNAFASTEPRNCYYIAVDGLGGAGGPFVLTWEEEKTSHMLPVILLPPSNRTVAPGASVTFTNLSVPECPQGHLNCNHDHWEPNYNQKEKLTYQWYFEGSPIPGGTNASFTISNVQLQHVGNYHVRVFTPWQYLDSRKASLQINLSGDESQSVQAVDKFLDVLFNDPLFIGPPGNPSDRLEARGELTAAATVVRGYTGTQIFNTTGSATEPGEVICGVAGGSSEWISFVPEQTGTLFLNTEGSTYDTVIAVFRRNATNSAALELLACDNNGGSDGTDSSLNLPVQSGTTNYVLVDGVNGAVGTLVLNYSLATTTILRIVGQPVAGSTVIQVNGRPALNFSLQASTNFANWTTLITTNAPTGIFNYTDTSGGPLSRKYYRALILP